MNRLLRNLKLLSAIGFVLLIGVIWFFGQAFGLATAELRLTTIFVVMLAWVFSLLIGRMLAMRAGNLVDRMFRAQVDQAVMQATPDQRGEVALLRKQLLEAIETLKKSNLGRTRGKAALYELPWYMIIGHPAAGKSSAIQNSGLVFPISDKGKGAIRGVGGTRNCDWFFTTDGVLLDTAGRYSTQREDRTEWLEFLRLLKAHRSRTPVNGILVAISVPELVQYKSEGFAEYARQIRARINEIDQAFSRKVPIYLLFTKVDLLAGFSQFFEDISEAQRCQVWGATLPHERQKDFNAATTVAQHFEELYRGLAEVGMEKLANSRNNVNRPALFAFPIEFNAMRDAVSRFVEILFESDPYHTHPLLRGFYFTSALQEGAPKIPAGSRVSAKFELSNTGFPAPKPPISHSFFLRDLFRDVIFPDQHLISRQITTPRNRGRWAALAIGVALLACIAGLWSWSFVQNQQLISSIEKELVLFGSPNLSDRLIRLNFIQVRLEQLSSYKANPPLPLGFGLYQGQAIENRLRHMYLSEVSQLLIEPVKANLEKTLATLSTHAIDGAPATSGSNNQNISNEKYYDTLKTYLMLHDKTHFEGPFLTENLAQNWLGWLNAERANVSMEEIGPMAEHAILFYIANFSRDDTPIITNQDTLVTASREYLKNSMRTLSAKERIYNEIVAQAASQYSALNLARILENSDVDLLSNSYTVPAAFTRAAWDGHVRQAVTQASRGTLKDGDWVLATSGERLQLSPEDFEKNRIELLTMYKQSYAREWMTFLSSLSVNNFRGLDDAVGRIDRLSNLKQSPLRRVYARVAYETSWDNPALMKDASAAPSNGNLKTAIVNKLLSNSDSSNSTSHTSEKQFGELEGKFALLGEMTTDKTGQALINPYLGLLSKIKSRLEAIGSSGEPGKSARKLMKSTIESSGSELVEGVQLVDGQMLAGADSDMRDAIRPVLMKPFTSSYGALLGLANNDINQSWQRQVLPAWQALADKYPFVESGSEALLSDISKFLQSEDGTLNKFILENLDGLIARQGNTYVPRRWGNMSVPFTSPFLAGLARASDIKEKVLTSSGASHFEIQPVPTPGLSEVLLEIDGQQLRYRNGPQLWTAFDWPGTQTTSGAKISVITFAGVPSTVLSNPGRMGWMRMASSAKANVVAPGTTQFVWMVNSPDNKTGERIPIRFNVRLVSGANPLAMNSLRDFTLPKKIVN